MKETLGGRYEVGELIGRGGMANVYRGTDSVLGRTVAIKVLNDQYAADPQFVARFRREAQAAAKLSHPNVVGVYDSGSDDGTNFIVMEYVQGRTLAEILAQDGRLLPERAIEIAEAVCDALAFAHAEGIVHRDIKPGNIMITRDGAVKVMDFGIARQPTQETVAQTAAVLGTAAYLSPEQARGDALDPRSDIYSLGIVLYEMLTGRPPFAADTPVAVAMAHVQQAPVPPSQVATGVPLDLDAVVMRALAKNPDNRYATTRELKQDLERVRAGQTVAAPPVATTQVIAPPITVSAPPESDGRGAKWAAAVIVGGIIIAGVVLAFLLLRDLGGDGGESPTPTPTGEPTVKVPDVVDLSRAAAEVALEDAGFTVEVNREIVTDPSKVDRVLDQVPAGGDEAPEGSTVTITVGREEPVRTITVPNLFGRTEAEARDLLFSAGLEPGTVRYRRTNQVPEGQVYRQDPPAGTDVEPESAVDFYVSSGPEKVEVPDVICKTITRAENTLQDAGLNSEVDVVASPNPDCPTAGHVGAQDPVPGELVDPGSTVTLQPSGP